MAHLQPILNLTVGTMNPAKTDNGAASDTPKFTYTTAGTIFNPDSVQPIQAPTRRSRTQKWGLNSAASSELTFLPKSIIANLPMSSSLARNSVPVNSSPVVPHYSPLQQNYDRAVSPLFPDRSSEPPSPADMDPAQKRPGSVPAVSSETTIGIGKPVDMAEGLEDDLDEDMSEDPISTLTVKSLNSLASYPNPNQQKAQKALRARPGARSAASNSGNTLTDRSATPSFGTFSFGCSDTETGRSTSPTTLRGVLAGGSMTFPPEGRQRQTGPVRQVTSIPPGFETVDLQGANNSYNANTVYQPDLGTGPGAPKPLTAGPPGQRQYKVANSDTALRNPPNSTPHKFVVADDDPAAVEFRALLQNTSKLAATEMLCPANASGVTTYPAGEGEPSFHGVCEAPIPESARAPALGAQIVKPPTLKAGTKSTHTWDTRCFDEVKHFYPRGGPSFQNFTELDSDWQTMYPLHPAWQSKEGVFRRSEMHIQRRNDAIHRQFYAGADAFAKSVGQLAREAENRHHQETVGVIGQGRPQRGQVKQGKLEIHEANEMSTAEAAKPFLTMMLTSMINGMEETERMTRRYNSSAE